MKSKNKLLAGSLCLLMIVFCIGLTSCGCFHQWEEWEIVSQASCSKAGTQERQCAKCGEVQTKTIPLLKHVPSEDDGDCTTAITCSVCGKVTTEAKDSHTGGKATCERKAVCTVCGQRYGELAEHEGETIWIKHLDSHYLVYSCCYNQASMPENHTKVDGVCTTCGFNPTVTISSVQAAPGDSQIEVIVSIADNPGIVGLMLNVQYASDIFTLTEAKSGDAMHGLTFTAPSNLSSGCTFLWDCLEVADEDIKNGELLILTFDISPDALEGEYSLLLKIKAYDNELVPFSLVVTGGKITIENK